MADQINQYPIETEPVEVVASKIKESLGDATTSLLKEDGEVDPRIENEENNADADRFGKQKFIKDIATSISRTTTSTSFNKSPIDEPDVVPVPGFTDLALLDRINEYKTNLNKDTKQMSNTPTVGGDGYIENGELCYGPLPPAQQYAVNEYNINNPDKKIYYFDEMDETNKTLYTKNFMKVGKFAGIAFATLTGGTIAAAVIIGIPLLIIGILLCGYIVYKIFSIISGGLTGINRLSLPKSPDTVNKLKEILGVTKDTTDKSSSPIDNMKYITIFWDNMQATEIIELIGRLKSEEKTKVQEFLITAYHLKANTESEKNEIIKNQEKLGKVFKYLKWDIPSIPQSGGGKRYKLKRGGDGSFDPIKIAFAIAGMALPGMGKQLAQFASGNVGNVLSKYLKLSEDGKDFKVKDLFKLIIPMILGLDNTLIKDIIRATADPSQILPNLIEAYTNGRSGKFSMLKIPKISDLLDKKEIFMELATNMHLPLNLTSLLSSGGKKKYKGEGGAVGNDSIILEYNMISGLMKMFAENLNPKETLQYNNCIELFDLKVKPCFNLIMEYTEIMNKYLLKDKGEAASGDPKLIELIANFDKLKLRYLLIYRIVNKFSAQSCRSFNSPILRFRINRFVKDFNVYCGIFVRDYKGKLETKIKEAGTTTSGGSKSRKNYDKYTVHELKKIVKARNISGRSKLLTKEQLVSALRNKRAKKIRL